LTAVERATLSGAKNRLRKEIRIFLPRDAYLLAVSLVHCIGRGEGVGKYSTTNSQQKTANERRIGQGKGVEGTAVTTP